MHDLLPDALADALAGVVADVQREWKKDVERIAAEHRAFIAELKNENATIRQELRERVEAECARLSEVAAGVKDGAPGVPGPEGPAGAQGEPGKDAEPVTPEQIAQAVLGAPEAIAEAVRQHLEAHPPKDGENGKDGKDVDPQSVAEMVIHAVKEAVSELELPKGEKGDPGPAGENGKDADQEMVAALVREAVAKAVAEIEIPAGEKGGKGDTGEPGPEGKPGQPGKDGASVIGAFIDREGQLVLTLADGIAKNVGTVIGKDGKPGSDGKDGEPGRDGFGFDDLSIEHDGERGIMLLFARGDKKKEFRLDLPIIIDRGVWKESEYKRGDGVSWGGSFFIAQEDTSASDKPEASKAWRLAVKRGRDGKDGVLKQEKPRQPVKV